MSWLSDLVTKIWQWISGSIKQSGQIIQMPKLPPPAEPYHGPQPVTLPSPELHQDYADKYALCKINPGHELELSNIKTKFLAHKADYLAVEAATGMPADLCAAIHSLESGMNFATYIQNGDPLFDKSGKPLKTVHVPAGVGPYATWKDSCIAAFAKAPKTGWTTGEKLYFAEGYNGWGYRNKGIPSPYIWSYTDQYIKGRYVADRVFDPNAISKQPGIAAILKTLNS